mgnify:CR=1 FL=1
MSLLELREDNVGYNGASVLRELDLTIEARERIALVGESGSGKTTLLSLISSRLGG